MNHCWLGSLEYTLLRLDTNDFPPKIENYKDF